MVNRIKSYWLSRQEKNLFINFCNVYMDIPTPTTSFPIGKNSKGRVSSLLPYSFNVCNSPYWGIVCICREELFISELFAFEIWNYGWVMNPFESLKILLRWLWKAGKGFRTKTYLVENYQRNWKYSFLYIWVELSWLLADKHTSSANRFSSHA